MKQNNCLCIYVALIIVQTSVCEWFACQFNAIITFNANKCSEVHTKKLITQIILKEEQKNEKREGI